MARLKEISLICIAAVLFADFSLSHLWPKFYFEILHEDYYQSVVACQKAKEIFQKAKITPNNSDLNLKHRLLMASEVELSRCNENEILKNKLISNGVEKSKLMVVYLEALKHKDLSLNSLVSSYEK